MSFNVLSLKAYCLLVNTMFFSADLIEICSIFGIQITGKMYDKIASLRYRMQIIEH